MNNLANTSALPASEIQEYIQKGAAMATEGLDRLGFTVVEPESALICRTCKVAVRTAPDRVLQHLHRIHSSSPDVQRVLARHLASARLQDVSKLLPRDDGSEEISYLSTNPGFACRHCHERTASEDLLRRHLSTRHWISWPKAILDRDYRFVSLQCWSWGGPYRYQWWIVAGKSRAYSIPLSTRKQRGLKQTRREGQRKTATATSPTSRRQLLHPSATTNALPLFLSEIHEKE